MVSKVTMPRRVQIGTVKGSTPKKVAYFNKDEAPSKIEIATPLRGTEGFAPLKGALKGSSNAGGRPTTSRGIARPSPDEFCNYISPSPDRNDLLQRRVLVFDDDNDSEDHLVDSQAHKREKESKESKDNEAAAIAIACWLFGSGLAI